MVTMLWTFTSEKWCTSLKKDISKSKRPGYMKQSLIQPKMMMLCREAQKQQTFYHLRNLFINFFPAFAKLHTTRSSKRENDDKFTFFLHFLRFRT